MMRGVRSSYTERGRTCQGSYDGMIEAEAGWEDINPIDWSSADVAVWWTAAADRGVARVNAAVAAAHAEPPAPPPTGWLGRTDRTHQGKYPA